MPLLSFSHDTHTTRSFPSINIFKLFTRIADRTQTPLDISQVAQMCLHLLPRIVLYSAVPDTWPKGVRRMDLQ